MNRKTRGFTLLELMVAVAVVGILAAIAYPSYQDSIRKGRRASAQSHLMDIAQRQQQYLLDARAYAPDLATLNMTTPSDVAAYYDITVNPPGATPPSFSVTAIPTGVQAPDRCGTLGIDNTGSKTAASSNCW